MMETNIKEYLDKQKPENKRIILKLRKILLNSIPGIKEFMGFGVMCYENLYYFAGLKNQVNMGFSIIGLSPEEVKLFEGTGKTMRHLKFKTLESVNEKELVKLIKLVKKKAKPVHI
ncbi:MAG: DUF1801 domain-containing protein [Nanoarchaeota archaeon]|nr:DUF1801 domain-containing protein [Nanoarchaeota archaeon]